MLFGLGRVWLGGFCFGLIVLLVLRGLGFLGGGFRGFFGVGLVASGFGVWYCGFCV